MSDHLVDTAIDVPTPILRALVYQEVLGPYDPVAIAITDPTIDVIEDKLDIFDVAEIPASLYRETYSGKHVVYTPPFTRGRVSIGCINTENLTKALLESGYIDKNKSLDGIIDVQFFEAKPVEVKYVEPGKIHFRKFL